MKNAALITIGDEVLSGTTIDTNSNFIAGQLKSIGISVTQIFTISDQIEIIKKTLNSAFEIADLVIATGGLGPTKDDKTKTAFAEYFDDQLVLDETTFEHLKNLLIRRKRENLLKINRSQAEIPSKAIAFQNDNGTAPSFLSEKNGKLAIALPGVPYEVKPLMKDKIIPFLKMKFNKNSIVTRTVSVVNFPESLLAQTLENWEDDLPENVSLSYLPIANRVKLKLTAIGENTKVLDSVLNEEVSKLKPLIDGYLISENGDRIEEILHDLLIKNKMSISVAESCTGGELAHLITSVSGSSKYFLGGIVAYDFHKKIEILGVSEKIIQEKTVVSEEVAQEMSWGCQKLFKTDIALSTTGVAGPNSDEFNNKIGEVFYSIRIHDSEKTFRLFLPHLERTDFMNFVSMKVLQDLILLLVEKD